MGYQENAYVSSSLISSYARNGFVSDALMFVASDNMPLSVVSSNLVLEMETTNRVEPEMDHYLLVVDLLARYGYLKEAERLILGMPFPPNALIWRSFLEGCKRQRTMEDLALAAETQNRVHLRQLEYNYEKCMEGGNWVSKEHV
ncbi:Protein BREAST CANCER SUSCEPTIBILITY 1 [Abeliophyllum distichum]|uniref:Protein BREAST CANCER SUSCEPTIBILITY 1 n=1 Tax=Abeliophyllum distichum TaxID=126358 RepID=A0ABD1QKE3_9LAMI